VGAPAGEDRGVQAPLSPSSLAPHVPHPLPGEPRHPGACHADPRMPPPQLPTCIWGPQPPVWPYSRCWAAAGAGGHGAEEKRGPLVTVPANGEGVEREGSPPGNVRAPRTHPPNPRSKNSMLLLYGPQAPCVTPHPKAGGLPAPAKPQPQQRGQRGAPKTPPAPERGQGGFGDPPPQEMGHPMVPRTPLPAHPEC